MSKETLNERVLKAAEYLPRNLAPTFEKGAEYIFEILELLGIDNSDQGFELLMSEHCKFGYAREVFVDKKGIPIVKFSKIWGILREGATDEEKKQETSATKIVLETTGQLSDKNLLEQYSPNCCSDIEEELRKRSKGRNIIVFESDRKTIDIDLSIKFLKQARVQVTPPEWSDGKNHFAVYPVGKWPDLTYDVCPITDSILVDDYCSELGLSWKGVDNFCRIFLCLAKQQGIIFSVLDVRQMISMSKEKGLNGLCELFPKIAIIYSARKDLGQLPILKTTIEEHRKVNPDNQKPFHPQVFFNKR